jgi:kynureninase
MPGAAGQNPGMTALDLRPHFSRFLQADPHRLHLAAHSHHYWPDVTFPAQEEAWTDAARYADEKWDRIFGEILPDVQKGVAAILGLPDPATIAVAPNTHDFVRRLLSSLPLHRQARVLTSDSEFHSFTRQVARLEEEKAIAVERVAAEPFATFPARFADRASSGGHDLVFVSQVFFNSGAVAGPIESIVKTVPDADALVVIDGYHGFMAVPTDLSRVASRAFYMSGGYKYAMAGEGVCFLHCPPGFAPRPRDTGWFASFGALAGPQGGVAYGEDGSRFLGATFDPSGLYRQRAVFAWLAERGLRVEDIHGHVLALQRLFLDGAREIVPLAEARLVTPLVNERGHFLTFETPAAQDLHAKLLAARIVTDVRGDRLRFGFGCYHVEEDVEVALQRIPAALSA